jgi:peroxiredoxin
MQGILSAAGPALSNAPDAAPDFTLLGLEGGQFSLSDARGRPFILFFWTTWCPYCRKELNLLDTMREELERDGVGLFAVNTGESSDRVRRFMESRPVSYRILLDTDIEVAHAFGVIGVPTYILVNKEGRIVFSDNQFPRKEYEELILK